MQLIFEGMHNEPIKNTLDVVMHMDNGIKLCYVKFFLNYLSATIEYGEILS